ncbi:MAG: DNA-binding protein [Bacteroidetes bacterium]|nr:DNA-binding protein [Bacteroidota bacterium]
MNITFNELRDIKHSLPTGSVSRLAKELGLSEQTIRNYFGANDFSDGEFTGKHIQSGPNGGIVHLKDTRILEAAKSILAESQPSASVS